MKILHLIQKKQLRGAEVFTSQLSSHITRSGNEAVMVSLFEGNASLPFEGQIIDLHANASKKYWDVTGWKNLAAIIKSEQPDIVQANAGDTLKYAIFSKLLFRWKQPVVFRNASTISLYIKDGFVKRLYRFLFSKTDKIVSVSQNSATDFGKLFPEFKNKITVIPIGIEELASNKTSQNPFNDLSATAPVLLHVGGFTFEKNHQGLIAIFKRILGRFPKATLHLVGDGPLRAATESLVHQHNLSANIFFHGYQKDPLKWIQNADVLLLPSIIEGLPGVILEAFYCQTPVVAYDTGGIKEILLPGKTGYLVPKEEPDAFAEAVINVIQDKALTDQMVANAHQLVTSEYMNNHIVKRFLDVYQKFCKHAVVPVNKIPVTEL